MGTSTRVIEFEKNRIIKKGEGDEGYGIGDKG
jgi:hypothetical protein